MIANVFVEILCAISSRNSIRIPVYFTHETTSRVPVSFLYLVALAGFACAKAPDVTQSQVSPNDSVESSVVVTYLNQPYENYLAYTVELFLPKGSVVQPVGANGYAFDDSEYIFTFNHLMFSAKPDCPPASVFPEPVVRTDILGLQQRRYERFATFPGYSINDPGGQNVKEYGYFLEPGRHTLTTGERFIIYDVGDDAYYFDVVRIRD